MEHGIRRILIILMCISINAAQNGRDVISRELNLKPILPIKTDEQQQQIEFQQTERFKEKAAERYKIEAKNAELKQVYGYDRAQSYGLSCMKMQGAMAIFAANLKRILKLS